MTELLGEDNEYGVIVENDDSSLLKAIKRFMDSEELVGEYTEKAFERGKIFKTENTVKSIEKMLLHL